MYQSPTSVSVLRRTPQRTGITGRQYRYGEDINLTPGFFARQLLSSPSQPAAMSIAPNPVAFDMGTYSALGGPAGGTGAPPAAPDTSKPSPLESRYGQTTLDALTGQAKDYLSGNVLNAGIAGLFGAPVVPTPPGIGTALSLVNEALPRGVGAYTNISSVRQAIADHYGISPAAVTGDMEEEAVLQDFAGPWSNPETEEAVAAANERDRNLNRSLVRMTYDAIADLVGGGRKQKAPEDLAPYSGAEDISFDPEHPSFPGFRGYNFVPGTPRIKEPVPGFDEPLDFDTRLSHDPDAPDTTGVSGFGGYSFDEGLPSVGGFEGYSYGEGLPSVSGKAPPGFGVSLGLDTSIAHDPDDPDAVEKTPGEKTISGGATKFLCTELHRQGLMPDEIYQADCEYAKGVNRYVHAGYAEWAQPLAEKLKTSPLLTAVVRPFVLGWARNMARRVGVKTKFSLLGAVVEWIGVPACYMIGLSKEEACRHE